MLGVSHTIEDGEKGNQENNMNKLRDDNAPVFIDTAMSAHPDDRLVRLNDGDLCETLGFGSKALTMMRKTGKAKSHSWPPPLPGRRRSANMEYAEWAPSTEPTTRSGHLAQTILWPPSWPSSTLLAVDVYN